MNEPYQPIKGKKRKLSRFVAEEMLYDYASGNLDEHRQASMQEFLESSPEVREELKALERGLAYCESLAKTEISPDLNYKLTKVRSLSSKVIRLVHWRNWPEVTKWTLEALVISVFVAIVAAVGWPKLTTLLPKPSVEFTLAEVEKDKGTKMPVAPEEKSISLAENSNDESSKSLIPGVALSNNQPAPASEGQADRKESDSTVQKPEDQDNNSAKVGVENSAQAQAESEISDSDDVKIADSEVEEGSNTQTESAKVKSMKKKKAKPKLKGFVYRMYMDLGDIEVVTEKIRKEIQALGGEKAGDVRLGWRKPKGSYFHFKLLEKQYDQIVEKLRAIGPVRIFKDPHWRVMPEGQIRFILWVEDRDLKSQTPTEKQEAADTQGPNASQETKSDAEEQPESTVTE